MYNKRQRMQYQPQFFDLPLRLPGRKPKTNLDSLQTYINTQQSSAFDLPRQITSNPYSHFQYNHQNQSQCSRNNKSISKCALTEMSTHDERDQSESLTPICQKLFGDHQYYEKQIDLPHYLPSQELITEATFKPNQLNQYLGVGNKKNEKLKKLLQQNVFCMSKNNSNDRKNMTLPKNSNQVSKVKTKYQRILQDYFNRKPKTGNSIKSRLSSKNIPNYKLNHIKTEDSDQNQNNKSKFQYYEQLSKLSKEATLSIINHCKSQRILSKNQIQYKQQPKRQLPKSFSQQRIQTKDSQITRKHSNQMNSHWMEMTFQERQLRTIQNRRLKENIGQQINKQKQVKNCTFKPVTIDFKPKPRDKTQKTYAKMYLQKIKMRM